MDITRSCVANNLNRVAWVLPFIVAIAMFGVAGDKFSLYGGTEKLDGATQAGLTLSFFAVIFGSSSGWSPVSGMSYHTTYPL